MKRLEIDLTDEAAEQVMAFAARYPATSAWFAAALQIYEHQQQLSDEEATLLGITKEGEEFRVDYGLPRRAEGVRAATIRPVRTGPQIPAAAWVVLAVGMTIVLVGGVAFVLP